MILRSIKTEMKSHKRRFFLLTIFAFLFSYQAELQSAHSISASNATPVKTAPGQLLVRFRSGTPALQSIVSRGKTKLVSEHAYSNVDGLRLVTVPSGVRLDEAIASYRGNPNVMYAEPDYEVSINSTNDPSFAQLWALQNTGQIVNGTAGTNDADMNIPEAWNAAGISGSGNVVIAVIDSGVQYTHPDLQANMWVNPSEIAGNGIDDDGNGYVDDVYGIDATTNSGNPADDNHHGTHVAGTIAAVGNNATGITGINQQAKILACKFLKSDGIGRISDALKCLDYIYALKIKGINVVVTNNSWGGAGYSQSMADAIEMHRKAGILFVVAADNDGTNNDTSPHYPANYFKPNVISVASTDQRDALAPSSDYGRRTVHVGAPGVNIYSTIPPNSYAYLQGTSMAAPHVTGLIGLLSAQNSTRDWRALKNLAIASGKPIGSLTSTTVTGRRVRAYDTDGTGALSCFNQIVTSVVYPQSTTLTLVAGAKAELAVLNINCQNPAGKINVTTDGPGAVAPVTLLDDGLGFDGAANDGIYSGFWTAPPTAGTYILRLGSAGQTQTVTVTTDSSAPKAYRAPIPIAYNPRIDPGTAFTRVEENSYIYNDAYLPYFNILFAGTPASTIYATPEGICLLNAPTSSQLTGVNAALPDPSFASVIAGYWDDLDVGAAGDGIRSWVSYNPSTVPIGELVFEWKGVRQGTADLVRFQIVYTANSSDIEMHYIANGNNGASATIGVQVDRMHGTTQSFDRTNTASAAGKGWRWRLDGGAPRASAGTTQSVSGNALVTLGGSGSDPDGGMLTYMWLQIGGSPVTLIAPNTPTPTFHAPNATGKLTFQLSVSDDANQTASATVDILVTENANVGTLSLLSASYLVSEDVGLAIIAVGRTGGSKGAVGVTYSTADVTATSANDYSFTSGTLTWADGETINKTFAVPITRDVLAESTESLKILLSAPTGGATLGIANATLTINDTPPIPGTLGFGRSNYSVYENGGSVTITIDRSGGSDGAVSVNYATTNGTASSATDFVETHGTLNFSSGQIQKTINISVTDDTAHEGDETVLLNLSAATGGASLGTSYATVTILDNEPTLAPNVIGFDAELYAAKEDSTFASITVARRGGASGAVSAQYLTSNGSATDGSDYTSTTGTISFADGETSKTFLVPLRDDVVYEGDETVLLTLSSAAGGATLGTNKATLTIRENDSTPPVDALSFGSPTYSVREDAKVAQITVSRTGDSRGTVSVRYATSGGTATAGSDYVATTGTLNFSGAVTVQQFEVVILDDNIQEIDETVDIRLDSPSDGASIGTGFSTLTIHDNSPAAETTPLKLELNATIFSVAENDAGVEVVINRIGNVAEAVTVDYTTTNGTATAGSDFVDVRGTLIFAVGETSKSVNLAVKDDATYEGNETFSFSILDPLTGAVIGAATAVITIADNESAPLQRNQSPGVVTLISPTDGNKTLNSVSVNFKWNPVADPDGDVVNYAIYYCADPTFAGCAPTKIIKSGLRVNDTMTAGLSGGLGLAMLGMVGATSRRQRRIIAAALTSSGLLIAGCSTDSQQLSERSLQEQTISIAGFAPKTTYYWKIVADDGKGGTSTSQIWSFSTV